ncbi:beta-catenin binding [Desmophyllum pertusum]|uniref:Beta-catenin binding n=1 Tax=Desmophyllum pertusum TaxID=174260 RepID=A0A9X0D4X6_9CNID|nr:beta-catenin binding [Desmophyllum pertusum]
MSAFGTFNRAVIQEWKVQVKAGDSGSPTKTNTTFVYIDVEHNGNENEPEDGSMMIIVNAYNGKFAGGIIGKAYYKDDDYGGDRNKYTMASQEYFSINEGNGNITAVANIPLGRYTFQIQVEEQKQRPGNFQRLVTSAAIKQSVAVQIFKLRKTSFFVGDYYDNIFKILGDGSLIFSIQKAPLNRVPLADQFGVEIFLAVQFGRWRIYESDESCGVVGLTIGNIGIDACAYEQQHVGKCSNVVVASSAFTVPDRNCSTAGTPCLHGGTCHNAVPKGIICECGRDYHGPECQSTTRTFIGTSYIHLEKLVAYERSAVSLQFMTGTADGLLLYQGPHYKGANNGIPDVMALMLVEGYVKLVITLGPHPNAPLELYMNRGDKLDNKQWHTVQIIRNLKKVTLRIDKCAHSQIVEDNGQVMENRASCEIEGEIWGSSIYLNGFGPLQIGGVETKLDNPKINYGGFIGCIRRVTDDIKMYDLENPLKEVNTKLGCKLDNNACPDCNGHGYCEPLWYKSICVCDLGYTGVDCSARSYANWYKPNSYTQYQVKQAKRKRRELVPPPVSMANEFYTNIALQVRISPNSSNVVVFLASNSLGTEFNRIDVKNHVLRYIFRLGDRMKILSIPQLNVTDDKYHAVIIKREGNRASLQIDYHGKVEGTTGGVHKLLNMGGGSFFTGGLPNVTEVRVVEAFVNSGGNAILRTADGNIISSGIGSGLAGYGSSSNSEFMGTDIIVGSRGQVYTYNTFLKMSSFYGMRAVSSSRGTVFIGSAGRSSISTYSQQSYTPSVPVKAEALLVEAEASTGGGTVVGAAGGAAGGASGGAAGGASGGAAGGASGGAAGGAAGGGAAGGGAAGGGAAGGGAAGGGASGGSGVVVGSSGGSGGGGIVTGATVLGGAASLNAYGQLTAYGQGMTGWTLMGATTGAEEIEVIGDFGGCTASNSYNGVDLDNDENIVARRQNVEFGCPCATTGFCLHGGTCVNAVPPYCMCPPGWSGLTCQNPVTEPKPGTRPGTRFANPAVIACVLVIILAILAIIGAVLLKRRPQPTVVAVVEDGHVHDNVRPYHDEGAGEEDNFGYDITQLMKYTYVENGVASADGGGGINEEEFTVAENKPLLQGALPGAGLQHGVTTTTKRRVVHPESIDVKQFIDTRVHEADGEYILSIDELHIYRYEGDDSDVDDLSELGDSDEEPDEEEEQEFAFLQEWGKKFDNLNHIFNEED